MRFTVQYIPLRKIRPEMSIRLTRRFRKLRALMWDCMHLIAVRKNRKDGSFIIVSGHDRYDYLQKHTKKKYAPCIVDESKASSHAKAMLFPNLTPRLLDDFPDFNEENLHPKSRSIIRAFLKNEPGFRKLTRSQQFKVLLLGIRYKKTVVFAMRSKVNEILSHRK